MVDAAFSMETAQKALENFASQYDVFSDDFSSSVILQPSQGVMFQLLPTTCYKASFSELFT
jgi:hypothetical protein